MKLPEAIQRRATELHAQSTAASLSTAEVGTIALATSPVVDAVRRVVLVSAINEETKIAQVHLATNLIEAATDLDLIVPPQASGYPVPLVVQAELYGPVFVEQIANTYGRLDARTLDAFRSALYSDGASLEGWQVGFPLRSDGDVRRVFKESELDTLYVLVESCRSWLEGAAAPVALIDPALLLPPPPGTPHAVAEDQFLDLMDAVQELRSLGGSIVDVIDLLGGVDALTDLERWWTEFGMDRRALRLDLVMTTAVLSPEPLEIPAHAEGSVAERVTSALVHHCAGRGDATLDLLSARDRADAGIVVQQGVAGSYCRARPRVLEVV